MIEEVEEGVEYCSPTGRPFKVLNKARHAQDCSWPMVVYTNLEDTGDAPAGTVWVISESLFLKQFTMLKNPLKEQPQ